MFVVQEMSGNCDQGVFVVGNDKAEFNSSSKYKGKEKDIVGIKVTQKYEIRKQFR